MLVVRSRRVEVLAVRSAALLLVRRKRVEVLVVKKRRVGCWEWGGEIGGRLLQQPIFHIS